MRNKNPRNHRGEEQLLREGFLRIFLWVFPENSCNVNRIIV